MTEQAEIELRQHALKSLLSTRKRRLGESLDQRIRRAGKQAASIRFLSFAKKLICAC